MPTNIDPSKVQWDDDSAPAIDASKVQWDTDVAIEEPPVSQSKNGGQLDRSGDVFKLDGEVYRRDVNGIGGDAEWVNEAGNSFLSNKNVEELKAKTKPLKDGFSPSTALLGRGTQESSLQGLGLPVMNEDVPKTGATPEKTVTVNTPFGQSTISADAPITKLGVEINKQVKSDGGDGYFDSFKVKQPQVEGSLVGDFSGSTAVKVQGKSGITGRINTQNNPDAGVLGDQGRVEATDKQVSTERERIASQVYNDPSLRDIVKVEKNGDRLIDPSKLNGWFEKYQKENGLEYLDANDKVYIRNKLYQSVADEKRQEKVLDEVKKSYSVEGKVDPITATNFVNELMPDIERQVSEKIVGELQGFADGLNAKVQSGAMTAEQASSEYDKFYNLQSATMYPKLMKERGDKLAEHYGLNEEAKKEFSKRYAEQAAKRALDENMGAYEFWKGMGWKDGAAAGLYKGMGDVVKLAGDALMMSGYEDLGQQISQTAKSQNLPDVQLPEFSAESLADPVWWNTKIIPTLPLMAEMIVPSLMTQGATAGALSTIGIKGLTNLLASGTAAGVTNRAFESLAEGAGQYANDIDKGLSPEIAAQHAADVTKKNYPLGGLDALQFAMLYAKIPPALKLALEGGTEYGEEVYQGWAQAIQDNPEMPFLKYAATPEGIESGVLGGMMGLAFGGVGALGTQKQGSKYQKASVVYDMLAGVGENDQKRGLQMIATLDDLYRTGMMKEKDYKEALAITQSVLEQRNSLPQDLSEKARKEVVLYNFQVQELERQKQNATKEAIEYLNKKIAAIPPPVYTDEEIEADKAKVEEIKSDVDADIKAQALKLKSDLGIPLAESPSNKTDEYIPDDIFIDEIDVVTPKGFTNRLFESNMQLGKAPDNAHISEEGYNYRTLSQKEIDAIIETGGVFSREGKQKGGNTNTKYWTKGNNKNWYGDKENIQTIRVSQDNFKENEVVRADNVEVYNRESGKFEPLINDSVKNTDSQSIQKVESQTLPMEGTDTGSGVVEPASQPLETASEEVGGVAGDVKPDEVIKRSKLDENSALADDVRKMGDFIEVEINPRKINISETPDERKKITAQSTKELPPIIADDIIKGQIHIRDGSNRVAFAREKGETIKMFVPKSRMAEFEKLQALEQEQLTAPEQTIRTNEQFSTDQSLPTPEVKVKASPSKKEESIQKEEVVTPLKESALKDQPKAGSVGVGGDVESTTNVFNETQKSNPTVWQKIKDAFYHVVGKVHEGFKNTQDFIDNAINGDTQFSELAKALKDKLGDIKTSFVDDLRNKEGKLAYGKHNKDGITVSRKSPHPLQTWFHEAVHKLTVDKLYDYEEGNLHKLSDKDIEAIQNLHRIFGNVQKILNDKGIETKQHNPFKNVREFVAEALTNPEFQEILNKFKGEGKSPTLLKQFLDAVSKLLGLKDGSILDDVFHHTENLFNEGKSEQKNIAEAYHDAKSKGIENDFTKAVEQSLKDQPNQPTNEKERKEEGLLANELTSAEKTIDNRQLLNLLGEKGSKMVLNAENKDAIPIDRSRLIEQAKRVAEKDGQKGLPLEAIAEAVHYEMGYPDDWADLRSAINKGGIELNREAVQRMIDVGVQLPKDIIELVEKPTAKKEEVISSPKAETKSEVAPEQKYKIGKSPQTYTLVEKLEQSPDEVELNEQPVKVRNDKTGEEQVVLETDLTKVKSKVESAKDKLAEAKAKAKQVYDEESKSGIAKDPYQSAKRKAEADRAVFDAYVDLAKEHIKAGIKKLSDFAKSIGEDISENIKNAWANANNELPDSQLKTAVAIVKNSIKGGLTKQQAIADAAKYIESTRWFAKFGSKEQSDNMTDHIAEHLSKLNDKDLEALSTKDFRKVFSNLSKSISDIASEKDFTEAKASVVENLVNYIKTNSQRFSDFDKRYFNAVLDNIKRAKTPISLGREVAKFNRSLKDFGFRDLYRNAADMRRKAKKNATKDKFGGITPDIRKFLSIDPREIPIEQLDRYIGHLEDISARAKEVNARIADIRDFNRMMQDNLDADTTKEEKEAKAEDPEFKKQVIGEVSKALKSDTFDTSNLIADEIDLVNRLKALTPDDLNRLTLPQLQQLGMMAAKLENGWLSNRVKLDILDKIDTQKQVEKITKVAPQIFRSMDEVNTSMSNSQIKETVTAQEYFNSFRKTSLNYIDNVLRTANKIFYTNFVYPFEQGFTQVKLQDGKLQNEVKALISKLKLPFPEGILNGKKFRAMNTKLSFYAKNLDWKANGGEGDLTKILLYGKDKNGNDHLRNAKISKEDKIYLREQYEALSKKYADKNGELDLEKMKADMSLGERNLLDYVKTKFETDIKPKLYFSETYNRGGSFIPQDEYNPRKILDERVTAPTADDMVSKMVDPETAKTTSSKASSTIERNQAVRFQSFNFVGDFMDTAHDAYVDYYISPIAKKVFSGLTELEKTASNKDVGKVQGLKLLLRDALLNIINTNYEKLSVPEKAINMGARIAINNMLTNAPRVFAEPASNIIGAATTVGFDYMARGMQQYTSDRKFWNELLHEANSPILNRVGRYGSEVGPVFENEIYIPNHTTKGISEKVGRVLDVLDKNEISEISKHIAAETLKFGDAVTILPTWTAAYMKSIEKQTGKPFSKETKYDAKTKQDAFAYADNISSQTHNVSSAFAQSRVIRESRQTFVKAVSWFLRGFILNDLTNFVFNSRALVGGKARGNDVSRAQAAQAMAGIMTKQIVYAGIMKSIGGLMYAGISTAIGAISDDDEEEKKIRQEEIDKMIEQAKEVYTAEGLAKNASMNLLQLATGKMNFVPMILANNIAESANKAVTGSSYDAYKDAITYSPDLTGKILDGKLNNIGFYDIKRMLGAYGVVADRMGLTAQEVNRITAKVAGDETLTDDELIKWKTMNAMFFNLQTMLSFPFSGTIQRIFQNEQRIQDGKADEYREAKVKYLKYKELSRDALDEALIPVKAAEIAKIKKTSKAKDMALIREFQAAENEVNKIKTVAEREAKKLYSKEEKMISDMGVEKPNEDGYVMDYVQKKTEKMTPAQKKEYLNDLYEKYIISRDTRESLKILTK